MHTAISFLQKKGDSAIIDYPGAVISKGKIYEKAKELFASSISECDISIIFESENGDQNNSFRSLILEYLNDSNFVFGKAFARRLYEASSMRSGPCLLFVTTATVVEKRRIVFSRFPADEGMTASLNGGNLEIEYIDTLFVKDPTTFKSAVFEFDEVPTACWTGFAVDKQINHQSYDLSKYWVHKFLSCKYFTTSMLGSKRLFEALKTVVNTTESDDVRTYVLSLIPLLAGFNGQNISIQSLLETLHAGDNVVTEVKNALSDSLLMNEIFAFDYSFKAMTFGSKSIRFDTGGILSAPVDKFDECFERVEENGTCTYVARGNIIETRVSKGARNGRD